MAKKSDSRIAQELGQLNYWKWQFLRRNEDYIRDCERWRDVPRQKWGKREVILGSKVDPRTFMPKRSKSSTSVPEICIVPLGLTNSTWKVYADKWLIEYPLNPLVPHCPFFVDVAPHTIIREFQPQMGGEILSNDIFLDRGTTSELRVDWATPLSHLEYLFGRLAREKQQILVRRKKKPADIRTQLRMFHIYLQVWDWRQKKLTYQEIVNKVYPGQNKSDASIKKNLEAAQKLINEGYKNIG